MADSVYISDVFRHSRYTDIDKIAGRYFNGIKIVESVDIEDISLT